MMLVDEISRDKDTLRAQDYTEIMPLTRCCYEHLRTEETHIYFKEIPQVIKAHPKIVVENLKYLFSHPSEYVKLWFNPVRQYRLSKNTWARLAREGKSRRRIYILPKILAGPIAPFINGEQGEHHDNSQRVG